ncbi:hypothetical protein EMCRGX_G008265 [Ephydatia muelleri]|eukprot:Em0002g283a
MFCSRVVVVACVVVLASLVWSRAEGACQPGQFDCTGAGTVCVSQQQVCDGQKNCAGGQDESPASCGCIKGKGVTGPGKAATRQGTGRRARGPCVCITSNVTSVVCGCAVGFVSDGQNGCKTPPPLPRPSTRPPPGVNATAPLPGPRTRAGAKPAAPAPRPSTKPRANAAPVTAVVG